MNCKKLVVNFVICFVGLILFELLYPHGQWGQTGARVALLIAGSFLGSPWDEAKRADAQQVAK